MLADALRTGTPNTRAELLGWLAVQMRDGEETSAAPDGCWGMGYRLS